VGKAGEVTEPASTWSTWRPLAGVAPLSSAVLAETLDGGQAFRWHRLTDDTWLGVWSENVARLRLDENQIVHWSAPAPLATKVARALPLYFGIERDFAALADSLPWRSDAHLACCIEAFRGLRILRQPFGETLLGFLCSATKQIVQIKQMVALLAERHGASVCRASVLQTPLASDGRSGVSKTDALQPIHRLPTWAELAEISEADLRACLLGFRARYIHQTARFLAAHPGWLDETAALSYAPAKERLCSLPGVGEKVADCVLLFGAGKLEAFPVDVWILKTLARRYGLEGWRPAPLAQFGRAHFGPLAGLAQQYLFAWERAQRPNQVSRNK
jgi:N-glycosylase/DNA lyase